MYACLDLGSNSFHLLIARPTPTGIEIVERFSEKVQLGEGLAAGGDLSAGAFARGIACLERFREVMERYPIQVYWALGTNALRVAGNATDFIHQAEALGFRIAIISGEQEGRLVYAGVVSALPAASDSRLVIDIGGGSTEMIRGVGDQPLIVRSLPIGCVSWRDNWFLKGAANAVQLEQQVADAVRAAEDEFAPESATFPADDLAVYASSGTAKMLAAICREAGLPEGSIRLEALLALRSPIIQSVLRGELPPGVSELRRELVLPGWTILVALMQTFHIQQIHYSPTALREGMLGHMISPQPGNDFPAVISVSPSHGSRAH